jgi:hypothetical protein
LNLDFDDNATIQKLIDIYINDGKFDKLGDFNKKLGDKYEKTMNIEKCINHYSESIKCFQMSDHCKYKLKSAREKLGNIYLMRI